MKTDISKFFEYNDDDIEILTDELHKWITVEHDGIIKINAHKYCKIILYARKHNIDLFKLSNIIDSFINGGVYTSDEEDIYLIDEHIVKFCKGLFYSQKPIYEFLVSNYEDSLFGEELIYGDIIKKGARKLTPAKAEYLLNYCEQYVSKPKVTIRMIKLIIYCKTLGYSDDVISKKLKLDACYGNKFYDYVLTINKNRMNLANLHKQYLHDKKFKTDAIACMEYVNAMYNSTKDIGGDVVISHSSIRKIMKVADVKQHLKID